VGPKFRGDVSVTIPVTREELVSEGDKPLTSHSTLRKGKEKKQHRIRLRPIDGGSRV